MARQGTLRAVALGWVLCGMVIGLTSRAFVGSPASLPRHSLSAATGSRLRFGPRDVGDGSSGRAASAVSLVLAPAVVAAVARSLATSKVRMNARGGSRGGARGGAADGLAQTAGQYFFQPSPDWQSLLPAIAGTAMRVVVALLVIHHGTEHTAEGSILPGSNPAAVAGFAKNVVAPYMSWLPILDSTGWTIVRDWTEVVCGFLMVIGLFTRPAAFGMCVTMILATYFHIEKTGWQGFPFGHVPAHTYEFELSLANTMVFAFFAVLGAGPISVDALLSKSIMGDAKDDKVSITDVTAELTYSQDSQVRKIKVKKEVTEAPPKDSSDVLAAFRESSRK